MFVSVSVAFFSSVIHSSLFSHKNARSFIQLGSPEELNKWMAMKKEELKGDAIQQQSFEKVLAAEGKDEL